MLLAATEGIEIGRVLRDVLVVLLAAKLAAEVAERVGVPAVLGEILAGILIGPSLLGFVEQSDVLFVLGELGVILLLLQVGMEMDLAELGKVGRAALTVAVVGVVAPFALGLAGGLALGQSSMTSVFLGAALTATSVGITARVFGDLRALASTEARVVLGAAVADDVLGLVLLTVVARVAVDGSVSTSTIASTIGLAIAFLLVTGVLGLGAAPAVFGAVQRVSRSTGTLTAVAFAVTLGFAVLADVAHLAPIIGAFMAGLAIGRTPQAHRIERDLRPVGHLFIPVFFLQIGIDTDVGALLDPGVIGIAAVLSVIAVAGKLLAAVGAAGTTADRWTIGFGMIPRGEVGLIFAAIGLRNGVLDPDLYASLVLVVLVTTVITPPLLRARVRAIEGRPVSIVPTSDEREPETGWVGDERGTIVLHATPPIDELLPVALRSARLATTARPGEALLDWFGATAQAPIVWTDEATADLIALLRHGNARSWRLLDRVGVLDRALPELAEAIAARRADPAELDPMNVLRWSHVDRLHELVDGDEDDRFAIEHARLEHPDRLTLAALAVSATTDDASAGQVVRALVGRLRLPGAAEQDIASLVHDRELLIGAAQDPNAFDRRVVLELATHLETSERARALYLLTIVIDQPSVWERTAIDELHDLVQDALSHPDLVGADARTAADARRRTAELLAPSSEVRARIAAAPRSFLLANPAPELVRQASLVEPPPRTGRVRVTVSPNGLADHWKLEVVTRDRPGLLARLASGLAHIGFDIVSADITTWGDGIALDTFTVAATSAPDAAAVAAQLEHAVRLRAEAVHLRDLTIEFDNRALPWHTVCTVLGPDRPAMLAGLAATFAEAGIVVHGARIRTEGSTATDQFALTDRLGRKLEHGAMDRVAALVDGRRSTRSRQRAGI